MGIIGVPGVNAPWTPDSIPVVVQIGAWSAEVASISELNPFMWQVDVVVPTAMPYGGPTPVSMDINTQQGAMPVGPLATAPLPPSYTLPGVPIPINVWVAP